MNADVLAEWFRRQGHRVVRTSSSYWSNVAPRVYQGFPYHWLIQPTDRELREFVKREGAIALRYSTPVTMPIGQLSYHVTSERVTCELADLSKKARYDVRKGLNDATVEPIPMSRLAGEGWALRAQTLVRQGRGAAESEKWWRRLCMSAEGLPGFEAWGAISQGRLVAALLAFSMEDCCSILYQQSRTDYLQHGVNNALSYAFTNQALSRDHISWVFYGLHSLDAPASVDEFKFRMGYVAKPVRQRVVLNRWLSPLFNHASHAALRQLMRWKLNPSLAKAEGIIRFYLGGKLPPDKQTVPECLRNANS